jgi:hypothetical protein
MPSNFDFKKTTYNLKRFKKNNKINIYVILKKISTAFKF